MRLDDALSSLPTLTPVAGGGGAPASESGSGTTGSGFKQAWNDAQSMQTVQPGDNLVSIVRQHAESQGVQLTGSQALRFAQSLASHNGMSNANRIYPGQQLNMSALTAQWKDAQTALAQTSSEAEPSPPTPPAAAASLSTAAVLSAKAARTELSAKMAPPAPSAPSAPLAKAPPHFATVLPNRASNATIPHSSAANNSAATGSRFSATAPTPTAANQRGASVLGAAHPVLDKTLDRAVSKGFIPANEKQAVYQKVLEMANKHGFAPDDFARMTLMESDGMNPKASNQRCHGIIQFCDGPARGAAVVGMASNPKSILGLSVYQQLHLADTYFQKAGLNKQQGSVRLDDLYLSVLQPAARSETRADAPLGIMGTQAGALYGDKGNTASITRQSLVRGLIQNAQRVLGLDRAEVKRPDNRAQTPASPEAPSPAATGTPPASRVQAQRVASYTASEPVPTQLR